MPASPNCPSLERWRTLLADDLAPDEEEICERHLRSCPACRELLDRAGEHGDALLGLAREVGDPTTIPADAELTQVLGHWHAGSPRRPPAPAEPADLSFLHPGERTDVLGSLGAYAVRQVIGQGGMGVVLQAYEPALHRLVAIKVMAPALAGSALARRLFTREAKAAAAVSHEHVVAVHAVHEAGGLPYLVMQYIDGESLQARLDRTGPLEVEEVVRIGLQTASGLAAAHAQGLIHRDIKPANLLLENGAARVKITDFGLARMADDARLTQAGVVAGTPEYMAPEQARGEAVDHRADLFSLGSVLHACCTGEPPFRGSAALAVLRRVSDEEPAPIRSLNPRVPAWLETLVGRLMAKDPAQRFQTAAEVAGLLEGYLAHLRQPAADPAPDLPPAPGPGGKTPRRPLRRWPWVVAALVLLSVLGLAGEVLHQLVPLADQLPKPKAVPVPVAPLLRTDYPKTFHPALQGNPGDVHGLVIYGPDASECVRFEPTGLHITLPADFPRQRAGTGVVTDFGVKGDFEITVSFEVLSGAQPGASGNPTELRLVVVPNEAPRPGMWQRADQNRAILSRQAPGRNQVGAFLADSTRWNNQDIPKDPWGNETFNSIELHTYRQSSAALGTGRLRLVRSGTTLCFFTGDGPGEDFTLLQTQEFGKEDLKNVRILGSTGGLGAGLDVLVTDVSIRAEGLGKPAAAAPPPAPPSRMPPWLVAVLALSGLSVAVAVALGAWLYARPRRRPAHGGPVPAAGPARAIVFKCPGCGKRLRARAEQAGSKPKCPQCGKAVVVPNAMPENPEQVSCVQKDPDTKS
jgi:serine/threonine protein kinase